MNGIGIAAAEIQQRLERSNHDFCFIGGIAVVYWGTPRSTQDVDLSLWVPLGEEKRIAEALLADFRPRIEDAAAFAEQSRILLIYASNDVPVDVAFASFPLEQAMITRSVRCDIQPGLALRLISAEDLIISKAIAGRPQDVADIEGILDRQQTQLDRPFIYQRLKDFCDLLENDDPLRLLEKLWE